MSLATKLKRYIKDPEYRIYVNTTLGLYDNIPDEQLLRKLFRASMGYSLNLENPKTFNEKLQWLKINNRNPLFSQMVDKAEAKKYVANILGSDYVIPTYGIWEDINDIDFDILPNQFVLKCTHNSGGIIICKNKNELDTESAKKKLRSSFQQNYYRLYREWPYKDVKPRIIAEQYMEDLETQELRDFKFFCFGGHVKCYKVDFDRFKNHHANYYDLNGSLMELGETVCPPLPEKQLSAPKNLEKMISFAERLSEGIPFIRVDFYEVNGHVYFGELTFYPASGLGKFTVPKWDQILGDWIDIQITDK